MRNLVLVTLVAVFSGFSGGVRAESSAGWMQEPDGFIGIKFSDQFPGVMPACQKTSSGLIIPGAQCYHANMRGEFEISNGPRLGFGYIIYVDVQQGVPVKFTLKTYSENFNSLISILVQRYGAAMQEDVKIAQNLNGASISSRVMRWSGAKAVIQASEHSEQIGRSSLVVWDANVLNSEAKSLEQKMKDGASKL
jgi:hypothetical protein